MPADPTTTTLMSLVEELKRENSNLRSKLEQLEQREVADAATVWLPLKAAIPPGTISYETGRVWAAQGHIRSRICPGSTT